MSGDFMASRQCPFCKKQFEPRPQVKQQKICSSDECQRERKRRWHQAKRILILPTMPTRESTPKSGPICTPITRANTELKILILPSEIEPSREIATKNVELL
jgi:hypothetical protein